MANKVEEKVTYKPCESHGRIVCTECNPVSFVTSSDDPYYNFYLDYYKKHGRESPKNHRELV